MAACCSRAELSTGEIKSKLYRLGISSERAEPIIARLAEERFIDNHRFARAFVGDKMRYSNWGLRKIRLGLIAKGIDRQVIEEAVADVDMDEYREIMLRLGRTKIKSLEIDITATDGRARLYRALVGRGYEPSVTAEVLAILKQEAISDNAGGR